VKFNKTISNPSFQEVSERFENHFDRVENQDTVDSIDLYRTILRLEIKIKGNMNMEFPAKLKLTKKGLTTHLNIKLDQTKTIVVSIIAAVLLGGVFYLVYQNVTNAGVFGLLLGIVFYISLRNEVSKSLTKYAKNLIKVENVT
jgi:hypothetical protein